MVIGGLGSHGGLGQQGARGQQPRLVGGEPAEQPRPGEDHDARDEDPAAPQ
jgi:hypothetical protein